MFAPSLSYKMASQKEAFSPHLWEGAPPDAALRTKRVDDAPDRRPRVSVRPGLVAVVGGDGGELRDGVGQLRESSELAQRALHACEKKRLALSQRFLCLFRAWLGKIILFPS
jgi:hypothetical protein